MGDGLTSLNAFEKPIRPHPPPREGLGTYRGKVASTTDRLVKPQMGALQSNDDARGAPGVVMRHCSQEARMAIPVRPGHCSRDPARREHIRE